MSVPDATLGPVTAQDPPQRPAWLPHAVLDARPQPAPLPEDLTGATQVVDASRDGWTITGHTWAGPAAAAGQSVVILGAPIGPPVAVLAAKKGRGFAVTAMKELLPGLRIILHPTARKEEYRAEETELVWALFPRVQPAIHRLVTILALHEDRAKPPVRDAYHRQIAWASAGQTDPGIVQQHWAFGSGDITRSMWWPWFSAGFTPEDALAWREKHPIQDAYYLGQWRREFGGDLQLASSWMFADQVPYRISAAGAAAARRAGWRRSDLFACIEELASRVVPQESLIYLEPIGAELVDWVAWFPSNPQRALAYLKAGVGAEEALTMETSGNPPDEHALKLLASFRGSLIA